MPFIIMDLYTRINNDINYFKFYRLAPNLFSAIYIMLIYFTTKCVKGKWGKIRVNVFAT